MWNPSSSGGGASVTAGGAAGGGANRAVSGGVSKAVSSGARRTAGGGALFSTCLQATCRGNNAGHPPRAASHRDDRQT